MKCWYISHDGSARKHVFQKKHAQPYEIFNGSMVGEPIVVYRWRKDGRWGVYRIAQIHAGRSLPAPLFQDKNRQTVMAWAQMSAALGITEGEKA